MVRLFVTRTAKTAPPTEVRIVVRDGASAFTAYTAVEAAQAAGFKKLKYTGTIPAKATHPADLPRHHLQDFETKSLFDNLLGAIMGC